MTTTSISGGHMVRTEEQEREVIAKTLHDVMPALRHNAGKPLLSFILDFPHMLEAFARVAECGMEKYERDNWKRGGKPDWEYLDACLRHLSDFNRGEYYADDTGCSHLAHAAWNLFALLELNYPAYTHDPKRFAESIEKWRRAKSNGAK